MTRRYSTERTAMYLMLLGICFMLVSVLIYQGIIRASNGHYYTAETVAQVFTIIGVFTAASGTVIGILLPSIYFYNRRNHRRQLDRIAEVRRMPPEEYNARLKLMTSIMDMFEHQNLPIITIYCASQPYTIEVIGPNEFGHMDVFIINPDTNERNSFDELSLQQIKMLNDAFELIK